MAKYIKLGDKAQTGSFYCPLLKLSLTPGQVVQAPKGAATASRVYREALQNNHIVAATEDEYDEYMQSPEQKETAKALTPKKKTAKPKPAAVEEEDEEEETEEDEEEETDEDDEDEEDDVESLTKSELTEALKASTSVPEEVKKNLAKMQKPELVKLYTEHIKK